MTDGSRAVIDALVTGGWTFVASVPDKAVAALLDAVSADPRMTHVPCTREEEAIGLCAGAAFAGRRGVLITQNSGIGNAVNALTSLIAFYELPLLILVSQRGGSDERIAAQGPMGRATRPVLEACGVQPVDVDDRAALFAAIANTGVTPVAAIAEPTAWSRILA